MPIIFPWKGVWKVKAPWRVSFFVWTAVWDRILTGDNLRGRRLDFVDWCIMCRSNGEMVDYLLLHCGKAYRLWTLVFRSFGFSWVLPRSIADTLFGCWNWLGKHLSSIWNLAPLCLMWCLWRERNRRTFEDMDSSDDQLLAYFSGTLFDWSTAWGLTSSDSLPMFLSSLLCTQYLFISFHYTISFPFVFSSLPYVFWHKGVFLNIIFNTYQKKKKNYPIQSSLVQII